MTMVSPGTDGDGDAFDGLDGPVDGSVDGEGEVDGAGVSSGGPGSMDGAVVGGTVGTWPRPPDGVQAAATSRAASASAGRMER
jgi:hypothetical protein